MADSQNIKKTVAKALLCVEKASSFASSIDPIFGVVSSLVGLARKGMIKDEENPLDKEFQEIHTRLESISQRNKEILGDIIISEVNTNYGKYEEYIKHQYNAFNDMVEDVRENPDGARSYMMKFRKIYETDKSELSLDVWYRGVTGKDTVFGRALLMVYLDHSGHDRKIMQHHCSHIAYLFHIGLIALMGYTSVTQDDEDEVREKWTKRMAEIQEKMQEVLSMCENESS